MKILKWYNLICSSYKRTISSHYRYVHCVNVNSSKLQCEIKEFDYIHKFSDSYEQDIFNFLVKALNCNDGVVSKLMENRKHRDLNLHCLKRNFNVIQRRNSKIYKSLMPLDKLNYLCVKHPLTKEYKYACLIEAGFKEQHLCAETVKQFKTLMKVSINALVSQGYLKNGDVCSRLLSHLEIPDNVRDDVRKELSKISLDDDSIFSIKKIILLKYFSWILNTSIRSVENILRVYPYIMIRNLKMIQSSLLILFKDFKFTQVKIRSNGFLLSCDDSNLKLMPQQFPEFSEELFHKFVQKFPRLLTMPIDEIRKVSLVLDKFGITMDQRSNAGNIYTMCSFTVAKRLQHLSSFPEVHEKIMVKNPRILELVQCYNVALHRLNLFRKVGLNCPSLDQLLSGDDRFKGILTSDSKYSISDKISYLSLMLKAGEKQIEEKLCIHPYFRKIVLVNINDSLNFLKSNGFTTEQVTDCVYIMLYNTDDIKHALEQRKSSDETENWKNSSHPLELLVYYIEADNSFKGDGVWNEVALDNVSMFDTKPTRKSPRFVSHNV